MNEPSCEPSGSRADATYLVVVGVLLVSIIAALTWLWMMERSRRITAEQQAERQRQRLPFDPLALMASRMAEGTVEPVRREDLWTEHEQVTVNGRNVVALRITAETARRLGFEPGDVILAASAQPATKPAARPAAEHTSSGPRQ